MANTISKNFQDHEIKGVMYIDGKRVLYLKDGVKRKWYPEDMGNPSPHRMEPHLNMELIRYERHKKFYEEVLGIDDYTNED